MRLSKRAGGKYRHQTHRGYQLPAAALLSIAVLTASFATVLAGFGVRTDYATGAFPASLVLADLNDDGKPDLAYTNADSNSIGIRLNTTATTSASPSFAAQQTFTTDGPGGIVVSDFNDDGKPDVAVTNYDDFTVSVFLSTTTSGSMTVTFAAQQAFATDERPFGIVVADFNSDGKPDIAVANYFFDTTVSVLLNTTTSGAGTPSFASHQTFAVGSFPRSVVAADFNDDGKPDLAVANASSGSPTFSILLNTTSPGAGTPSFSAAQSYATGDSPTAVATADFNGDGRPDLAFTMTPANTVGVLLNVTPPGAASASLTAPQFFAVGSNPVAVTATDINGDGKPDLAVANDMSDTLSVLINTTPTSASTPTFSEQQLYPTGSHPGAVRVADLNADGKPDIAVTNSHSNTVSVRFENGDSVLQFASATYTVSEGAGSVNVTLTRSGNTGGIVSANVTLTGGTAVHGQDFEFASTQMVTWADGEDSSKSVSIPISPEQH